MIQRDSAGTTIVENFDSAWTHAVAWRVDSTPSLRIGAPNGIGPEVFSTVRDATRLEDGTIVVADGTTNELRFFDPDGRHVSTTGGTGDGPAEFRFLSIVTSAPGDSLKAADLRRKSYAVFGRTGELARTVPAPRGSMRHPFAIPIGWFEDGSFVVQGPPAPPPPGFGPAVTTTPWLRLATDSERLDTIAEIPNGFVATDRLSRSIPIHVRPSPVNALARDGIWYGVPLTYELRRVTRDGKIDLIVRRRWDSYVLSQTESEQLAHWFRNLMMGAPSPEAVAAIPAPLLRDTIPAFKAMHVDRPGNLWVQEYASIDSLAEGMWPSPSPPGRAAWTVFDSTGRWLGSVRVPAGLTIHEIGEDYLLGVWRDELDVEYVQLHPLWKPDPGRAPTPGPSPPGA